MKYYYILDTLENFKKTLFNIPPTDEIGIEYYISKDQNQEAQEICIATENIEILDKISGVYPGIKEGNQRSNFLTRPFAYIGNSNFFPAKL